MNTVNTTTEEVESESVYTDSLLADSEQTEGGGEG